MTSSEIRKKFLEFFKEKGHAVIPSASLIPSDMDPTALFTTAGMQPLIPYLLGEKYPDGNRLANSQKCVRTGDIDEVGDESHLTFFEMLGNWSLGDYFKNEAIEWSWEFLTDKKWLGIEPKRLAVSVFAGDENAPRDDEAAKKWLEVSGGALEGRIDYLPKEKNWWGPAGETGPCGPDTEMFYWIGEGEPPVKINPGDLAESKDWLEIWNDVFMEYNKNVDGKYEPLKQKNVDTGMGLERITMVMNNKKSVYETDLFGPIINKIEELSNFRIKIEGKITNLRQLEERSKRIVADHIRTAVFMISDGVIPDNNGGGYVLRKIIRRTMRHMSVLNIEKGNLVNLADVVIEQYGNIYKNLKENLEHIREEIKKEEEKFDKTLDNGLKELKNIFEWIDNIEGWKDYVEGKNMETINFKKNAIELGKKLFFIYQTYGFPFELSIEVLKNYGKIIVLPKETEELFKNEMTAHQELSRTASAGMFKGGLADAGEMTIKYHTATHLLLASLREILGLEIYQKGSNINAERLRFDFNWPDKLTPEQIKKVENLVNEKIKEAIPVEMVEIPKEEALKSVKVSFDPSKYGDVVRVYKIGDFSAELCGGPHVKNTGELGNFKIQKEESSSAGVRRIKAELTD